MIGARVGKARDVFTGLIEEVGVLERLSPSTGGGARVRVRAKTVLEDVKMGDSIAVNGTCLTAVAWDVSGGWVEFDAVAETLRLTTLTSLAQGTSVNLERALAVADGIHCASRYRRSIAQGPILVDGPYFRLDQIAGEPSLETCTFCPGGLLALPLEGEVFSKAGSTRAQAGACLHACSIDALDFYRRSNPCL